MTKEQIYDIWRPADSPWTRWVQPLLFAYLGEQELSVAPMQSRECPAPVVLNAALIVDLPGDEGLALAMAMSRHGFRPVPVYNALPAPAGYDSTVDVGVLMRGLCGYAPELSAANLAPGAPPVFVLDAGRSGGFTSSAAVFINRSFCREWDFPLAPLLKDRGVSKVVVIQPPGAIAGDLCDVLLAWQREGVEILRQEPWTQWAPRPAEVHPPNWLTRIWEGLGARIRYRVDPSGSFGGFARSSASPGGG